MKRLLLYAGLLVVVGGCHSGRSTLPSRGLEALDKRMPVPLLPRMAEHQREQMRDHLAAVQAILAAVSAGDFSTAETNAVRIGFSEQMGQMCERMGAGAPGFNEMALNFHHTADTIAAAARTRDTTATLKAVSATVQTCVSCHATYRQQIVNEATWERIVSEVGKTKRAQPGKL